MKRWIIALMFVSVAAAAFGADGPACDMKRVAKVLYCESESKVLERSDLASGKAELRCAKCGKAGKKAGDCPDCAQPLEETSHPKGTCNSCGGTPVKADACVKEVLACPKCHTTTGVKVRCTSCDVKFKKAPHHALVRYVCGECGAAALQAGKCVKEDCANRGKKLTRTCTQSGTEPHVKAEKKKKKPKKEKKGKQDD